MAELELGRQIGDHSLGLTGDALARLKDFSNACNRIRGDESKVNSEATDVPGIITKQPDSTRKSNTPDNL